MTLSEQENAVLAYYGREARCVVETEPLAGLPLGAFRAARTRLIARGLLARSTAGRYLPIKAVT